MQVEPDPLKLIAPSVAGAFPPSIAKSLERLCICAVAWDGDPPGSIVGGGNGVKSVGCATPKTDDAAPGPDGLSMQTPPTPVTDCSHICKLENPQSSEVPSAY
jgi:hypothetical protein